MTIGTKSVLFGAHCFFLHPIAVMRGWWFLYGKPRFLAIWASFLLHDIGYIGLPNIDGPEGELHPVTGAAILEVLFGGDWFNFSVYHSRSYAKLAKKDPSPLCYADKMAFCFQFKPLYLLGVRMSGELKEYMANAAGYNERVGYTAIRCDNESNWYDDMCGHMARVAIMGAGN